MAKRFWSWAASWLAELAMRCYERAGKKVVTEVGGGETSYTITNRPPHEAGDVSKSRVGADLP